MSIRSHFCLFIVITCLFVLPAWSCAAISVVDGFDPNANETIKSIAMQPDGKVLVCGYFTTIGGQTRNHIGRLNIDGSIDTTFNPNVTGDIYTVAVQQDGKILVGGYFTALAGQPRNNIGRLNTNGTLDTTFNPGADSEVFAITVQSDGKILVGGWFSALGGQSRYNIGRLNADGSLDSTFNPSAGREIYSIALQSDGKILVGGAFTALGGQARNRIGRLNSDGSLDSDFNPDANGNVLSIVIQADGRILVGGSFTTLNGQVRNRIGRLNPDGRIDLAFDPDANDAIRSIVVQPDGKIILGGFFTTLKGQSLNRTGRLHPDGTVDTGFNPDANNAVYALFLQSDGKVLMGGSFTSLGGQTRNFIGRIYSDGSIETTLNPGANGTIYSIALRPNGKILVGGVFTSLGGQSRSYIGQLNPDGSLDMLFNPEANNIVSAIALQNDDRIVVGGSFTTISGQSRNGIARLNSDGSLDSTFEPGAGIGNGGIDAIAIQPDGKILISGTFTTLGGETRNYIGRLNVDGSLDMAFNPGIGNYSTVKALSVQPDGKILVGGYFNSIGGYARSNIGRLNPDGSLDISFNPGANADVDVIDLQPDGKIILGGYFTTLGGQSRTRIGRLNVDGSIDTTFNPGSGADSSVYAIAIQSNGKLVLGGQFVLLGGQMWKSIGRLNADGSLDTTFHNPGVNGTVNALALQSDGKVLLGGTFTTFNAQPRSYIGRQANTDLSVADLTIDTVGEKISWMRSGASPEVWRVSFEQSSDGDTWTMLGDGTRVPGGWEISALSLPVTRELYVRARGYAPSGESNGSNSIYESIRYYALPTASVVTGAATSVTKSSATLNSTVNSYGVSTAASFEYGLDTGYGSSVSAGTIDAGTGPIPVSVSLNDLSCSTLYHFRILAQNPVGISYGDDAVFFTDPCIDAPSVTSGVASAICTTSATLQGDVAPNGAETSIVFEYGPDTSYGLSVPASQSPLAADAGFITATADLGGLTCGTIYHYRVVAQNSEGASTGLDSTFTTTSCPAPGSSIIKTVAGNGAELFAGDDGPATSASLYYPEDIAVDDKGNLFIADYANYRVRKAAAGSGIISTIAGTSSAAFDGDGGLASAASLNDPTGLAVDKVGNLYIADKWNNRIRRIDSVTGIITTVAGNGSGAFSGDGGLAASASLYYPQKVAVDNAGNLYIADTYNNRIRMVDASTGIITTVAGNGIGAFSGDGGPAIDAGLHWPYGVAVDNGGNLYVADYLNLRIRKIEKATGNISTVAGRSATGLVTYTGEGGAATDATLPLPSGVAVDGSGNVFITEANSSRILKVDASSGIINTVAGNGISDFSGDGGEATSASLHGPTGVTVDSAGNLYIADNRNHRIRKVIKPGATTATIGYTPEGPYKAGDMITITATFNDLVTDFPVPQIALNGANTLAASDMTKVDYSHYTFPYTVAAGSGAVTVSIPGGLDINAVPLEATPVSGATFMVVAPPAATTGTASSVSETSATLNGTVSSNGASTAASFEYGPTASYGMSVPAAQSPLAADASEAAISASIDGLSCNTTYHYRAVGVNSAGTTYGSDRDFTTAMCTVNGVCGPANGGSFNEVPVANLCASGTPSTVDGSGPWNWNCNGMNGGTDESCGADINYWSIIVTIAGSGNGTVNSDPPGIACSSGTCSHSFPYGTIVSLFATPDWKSTFEEWNLGCTGTGTCSISLSGDTYVTPLFASNPKVKLSGAAVTYASIQDAYSSANDGETLLMQIHSFLEDLFFDREINLSLKGGMDPGYSSADGITTIHGALTIQNGSVNISDVVIW